MNRKIIQFFKIVFIGLAVFGFFNIVYADTTIHLTIKTPTNTLYNQDIPVAPCDSDNAGTLQITPYCAIRQSGIQNDWNWAWAPGAFLNSLGNIAGFTTKDQNNNDVYHYWSWSLNGAEGTTGLNQYELQPSDLISLDFIDPQPSTPPSGGGPLLTYTAPTSAESVSIATPAPAKPVFDIKKAFDFLIAQQKENGSFGENLYTDWIAMALASGNYQDQTIKLVKYFGEYKTEGVFLTDYERHAMALMALGLNPYNTNGENYIEKITAGFDGKQFGDAGEDNDDIFALIVLQNAGYSQNEKMINDDISFVLGRQRENGSWDESVDMTGAGIEALSTFSQNTDPLPTSPLAGGGKIQTALEKARTFLKQNQKDNGGWNNNASSTAWALEGILALNERPEDWAKIPADGGTSGNTPFDYFATLQDTDGGIKNENLNNKIWETAYAVSALSGKTWNQIMQKFEKPVAPAIAAETPAAQAVQTNNAKTKTISVKPKLAKLENLANQNTATVLNAVQNTEIAAPEQPIKKNWFMKLLGSIFGF